MDSNGLHTCCDFNKQYRQRALLFVHAEQFVVPPKEKTVLDRGAILTFEMLQRYDLGIYSSSTIHPHLADECFEERVRKNTLLSDECAARPKIVQTLDKKTSSLFEADIRFYFAAGRNINVKESKMSGI